MIIKKITTAPFAGIVNCSLSFTSSLNVVLGPNEAGKSTFQKALWFALFVPTNLKAKEFQKIKSKMIPARGGDYAEVEVVFEVNNQEYILKKRWGAAHESLLQMPDGNKLKDEDGVSAKLAQLTGLNKATYSNVFFTFQSKLGQTVDELKASAEVQHDLSNVLRNAIIAQGGVNIDHLTNEVDQLIYDYELNWDFKLNRPMNGKDVDNPYKRDVGKILQSYYKYRSLELQLSKTIAYEKKMDALISATEGIASNLKGTDEFLKMNAGALADAKVIDKLNHEIEKAIFTRDTLRIVLKKWPELLAKQTFEKESIKRLTADIDQLTAEQKNARQREGAAALLEKHQLAAAKMEDLQQATTLLKQLPAITEDVCQKARELESHIQHIRIELEAQKLHIGIEAKAAVEGSWKSGGEPENSFQLQLGQIIQKEAVGAFSIDTDTLSLWVKSTAIGTEQLMADLDKANSALSQLLFSYQVKSVTDLLVCAKEYSQAREKVANTQHVLKAILNGSTFEEISARVAQINTLPHTRSSQDIQKQLDRCNRELGSARKSVMEIEDNLKMYEKEHGNQNEVLEKGLANKQKLDELHKAQQQITPLPAGYSRPEALIAEYERIEKLQKELRMHYNGQLIARKEQEKEEPAFSSAELVADLELAKAEYARVVDEHKAYCTIRQELKTILDSIHSQTFNPLYDRTKVYLSELTCEKYTELAMEETIPVSIGSNGSALPTDLLSKGTTDCLALALRLAMAEHHLAGRKGFLILDDPLVDMDAQRQGAAASALNKYAQSQQVIIFTCHSVNAEELKGNTIKI
ncbi:AAA family ATPase [Rhodocytophaga aerolata]|uniref:AAA family ATPase n=1 Tax=Rhodocytophaga aerolata TaxID=455078 RepID=A0ABT8RHS7_9BACT|nr:AAA family ATPase [Rhodocytophaga aerolata]MDO1450355.1 AAA family ATPase [Rhodocytophaga aerolata]